ncbi:MAG: hypothetical protein M1829_006024 [Trizodia sp. TS-e1964]|nr:MAG: hypothetical protein M1829_006024 [Trizodia sp. TS-e1964]
MAPSKRRGRPRKKTAVRATPAQMGLEVPSVPAIKGAGQAPVVLGSHQDFDLSSIPGLSSQSLASISTPPTTKSAETLESPETPATAASPPPQTCPLCKYSYSELAQGDFRTHIEVCHETPAIFGDLESESVCGHHTTDSELDEALVPSAYASEEEEEEKDDDDDDEDEEKEAIKYRKLTEVGKFLAALRSPETRTTTDLYKITQNVSGALKAWQDEWMEVESRLAPYTNRRVKNPRALEDPVVFQDKLEAELLGFKYDPSPVKRGLQEPWSQKLGKTAGGKELRRPKPAVGVQDFSVRASGATIAATTTIAGTTTTVASTATATPAAETVAPIGGVTTAAAPRKRGRPKLNAALAAQESESQVERVVPEPSTEAEEGAVLPAKRRGRPPRIPPSGNESVLAFTKALREEAKENVKAERVKSATRSQAMTRWWAGRKRDQAEMESSGGPEGLGAAAEPTPQLLPSAASAPKRKGRPPGRKAAPAAAEQVGEKRKLGADDAGIAAAEVPKAKRTRRPAG